MTNKAGNTETYGELLDQTTYMVEFSCVNYIINQIRVDYVAEEAYVPTETTVPTASMTTESNKTTSANTTTATTAKCASFILRRLSGNHNV